MNLEGTGPQMARQLELPQLNRGEAPTVERSEEASSATGGEERSGTRWIDGAGTHTPEPSSRAEASEEKQG